MAAKDRLPGDINRTGYTTECLGDICPSSTNSNFATGSFPAPYNTTAINYSAAPFVDLYLEGLINFKPAENSSNVKGENLPNSKIDKNIYYASFRHYNGYKPYPDTFFEYNIPDGTLAIRLFINSGRKSYVKLLKALDEKSDDGDYLTGKIRTCCTGSKVNRTNTYDDSLENGSNGCADMVYVVNQS